MKRFIKLAITLFLFTIIAGLVLISCFDEPEYSNVPAIEFENIQFVKGEISAGISDSLILYINFKDGDGDLGLDELQLNEPYNSTFYYLTDGDGGITPVGTNLPFSALQPMIFYSSKELTGKLVTVRTREEAGYEYLPAYEPPYTCTSYTYGELWISEQHANIFDDTYNLDNILHSERTDIPLPDIYILKDTFYYSTNAEYYNIELEWLIKNGSGAYEEFDWNDLSCGATYNGRFPVMTDDTRAVEGTIKYEMVSTGFYSLFSTETMKLRMMIRDRALNKSNVVETGDFTLNDIVKN